MTETIQMVPLVRDRRGIRRFLTCRTGYDRDPQGATDSTQKHRANPLFEHAEMALWVARGDGMDGRSWGCWIMPTTVRITRRPLLRF
jgi:hypothetical protein